MITSLVELIDELERLYPNRLPSTLRDFDERQLFIDMGKQEVIRVVKKLVGKD